MVRTIALSVVPFYDLFTQSEREGELQIAQWIRGWLRETSVHAKGFNEDEAGPDDFSAPRPGTDGAR